MPIAVKLGKRERQTFSKIGEIAETPNLIQIQTKSYEWFVKEGLKEIFEDFSPIQSLGKQDKEGREAEAGSLILEFVDCSLGEKPKYSQEACKERDATYATQLKVSVRLINEDTGEIKEQEVFMGNFPLMTETGTFIYNGAERVVVTQLVRAPGPYFSKEIDLKTGKPLFKGQLIPNKGAWLEYEVANDVLYVKVDRNRKQPITLLVKAMGQYLENEQHRFGSNMDVELETNSDLLKLFGDDPKLISTLEKDFATNSEEALKEIYKKLRPDEADNITKINAWNLINSLLFDSKRYDVSKVGRYKYNKKLCLSERLYGGAEEITVAEDVINPGTGEIILEKNDKINLVIAKTIENAGVKSVLVNAIDDRGKHTVTKVIGNNFVELSEYVEVDRTNEKYAKIPEKVYYPVLRQILDSTEQDELLDTILVRKNDLYPKHLIIDDVIASVSYLLNLEYKIGNIDDIDHLGNRRLKTVGELLQHQFRVALSKIERAIKDRMATQDIAEITPQGLINIKPVTVAIREFFGSSQLSQFMDQTNPLSELTHKRKLSALGPGGLSRERASFEVRDVHHSHYGRMCPIETPEGPNIGLIGSLTTYGIINEYGFIETPYRVVEDGIVTKEIKYLSADEEERMIIAQANEPLDSKGMFANLKVASRGIGGEIDLVERTRIDYMDVSPKQVVSVATAMIPFLENDDANRALMGANMQRQAVPLIVSEAPIVGTGMEAKAARDSGVVKIAKNSGVVEYVDADLIKIRNDEGNVDEYNLLKFKRSNQGTCINQRPIVFEGEKVEKGEILADGPSVDTGEISLGKNLLVGFMTWEGYNYEDAIILNERLVMDDVLTSVHIEKYEAEARETKLGAEEITRDIPGAGETALRNLDENGVIVPGSEVKAEDILVGKVTPKGESSDISPEERLLRAIFGEKAKDVKDTSLKMPHGEKGVVVSVKTLSADEEGELSPGIKKVVRCYVATKRKISVGDKMAGRHGNKGVVSTILPEEDMPFTEDGVPLQVMLNPLGVPSRMNIGQILEVHLGLAAKDKGWHIATPVFDGANERDIRDLLKECGHDESGKLILRDGRTGQPFDNPVTVGYMYMLKLHHLVDDKMHARSTKSYSLVTQQPLGGKAQFGGQRFGEMEVWALEAYGAAYTLQEILTLKSDDISGRENMYKDIVAGDNIKKPGTPESFKVLIKEMQSLGLDVKVYADDEEVILKDFSEINEFSYLNPKKKVGFDKEELGVDDIEISLDTEMDLEINNLDLDMEYEEIGEVNSDEVFKDDFEESEEISNDELEEAFDDVELEEEDDERK